MPQTWIPSTPLMPALLVSGSAAWSRVGLPGSWPHRHRPASDQNWRPTGSLASAWKQFWQCLRIVWGLFEDWGKPPFLHCRLPCKPPRKKQKKNSRKALRNVSCLVKGMWDINLLMVLALDDLLGEFLTLLHISLVSIGSWVFQMPCNKQHCQKRRTSQCRLGFNTVSSKGAKPSSEELVGKPQFTRFTTRFSHGFPMGFPWVSHGFPMEVGDQATWWWRWAVPSPMDTSHPALPPQLHDHHRDVDARNHLWFRKMWSKSPERGNSANPEGHTKIELYIYIYIYVTEYCII